MHARLFRFGSRFQLRRPGRDLPLADLASRRLPD